MKLPNTYNYLAVFLTMRCCYSCSYCVNWKNVYEEKNGEWWVKQLNRIETNLPITICGGEPSIYGDFYYILSNINHTVHVLTNLQFDPRDLVHNNISPEVFDTRFPFAPIRVSFHSEFMDKHIILAKLRYLADHGYKAAVYCVESDSNKDAIEFFKAQKGIDFQTKPLLDNKVQYGSKVERKLCRTKELLISPNGILYKCHRDLYKKENPIAELSEIQRLRYKFRGCYHSNECHPCDLKIKRDRFGVDGYCAVEIK